MKYPKRKTNKQCERKLIKTSKSRKKKMIERSWEDAAGSWWNGFI